MAATAVPYARLLSPSWTGRSWCRVYDTRGTFPDQFRCRFKQDEEEKAYLPLSSITFTLAGRAEDARVSMNYDCVSYCRSCDHDYDDDVDHSKHKHIVEVSFPIDRPSLEYDIHDGTFLPTLREDFFVAAEAMFKNDEKARAANCKLHKRR